MIYQTAALLISMLLLGCTSTKDISFKKKRVLKKNSEMRNRLITISTGRIGCPPEVIEIKDYYELNSFHEAWTAICFKRVFYCSYNNVAPACSERINSPEGMTKPMPVRKAPLTPQPPSVPKAAPVIRKVPQGQNPARPELPEARPAIRQSK
ncbi:MAG: hypothetical protein HRU09_02680 [Oligoflexales bacterium]|nr:hypothetical protein [Oligoflexales bacterium]